MKTDDDLGVATADFLCYGKTNIWCKDKTNTSKSCFSKLDVRHSPCALEFSQNSNTEKKNQKKYLTIYRKRRDKKIFGSSPLNWNCQMYFLHFGI